MMRGLTNVFIERTLSRVRNLKLWDGVYPCDRIPLRVLQRDFAIIVNLSNHNEAGTHFIAMTQIGDKMFYFDSLATNVNNLPHLLQRLIQERNGAPVITSPIQGNHSNYCGFYCIYFILYLSLLNHRHEFSPNRFSVIQLYDNDKLCMNFIYRMLSQLKHEK